MRQKFSLLDSKPRSLETHRAGLNPPHVVDCLLRIAAFIEQGRRSESYWRFAVVRPVDRLTQPVPHSTPYVAAGVPRCLLTSTMEGELRGQLASGGRRALLARSSSA